MNETRNKPRLFLIAPPFMDRKKIAEAISSRTGQVVISRTELEIDLEGMGPKEMAELVHCYVTENDLNKMGWILYDYPNTNEEAKELLLTGAVPTHTFLLIPLSKTKTAKQLWIDNLDQWTTSDIKETWNKYQRLVRNFRYTFRETFLEINILCKPLEQILQECTKRLKEFPIRGPPSTPRVVLIGSRGSRRGQLAKLLHDKLGLIPVDLNEVIEEAKIGDNEMAEQISFLCRKKVPLYASIILKLLQDRLMREDCLKNGWVLIKFPRDRADLQAIDSFDTPPNRIIFLTTNSEETLEKLRDIRIHKYTGTIGSKEEINRRGVFNEENNYFIHPTDDDEYIKRDHAKYASAYQEMIDYCGEDCAVINAMEPIEQVLERIESIIGRGTGVGGPRLGNLKYKTVCKEDKWGLGMGEGEPLQEHTAYITSSPYLHEDLLPRPSKQHNKLCSNPLL